MNLKDVAKLRLKNQKIINSEFNSPKEIVSAMGAMQAQDYNMVKWAVGVRSNNLTDQLVESAISKGEIIRTHLLRPTWHLVSSDDIYWMLELTAPRIKSSMRSRRKELGLTEEVVKKCEKLIKKMILSYGHSTREELISVLEKSKISTKENRASHIFLIAELDRLICSGEIKNKKQTYALLEERVSKTNPFQKEEALGKLALNYFKSHGPATLQDFAWWSGLSAADSRSALEMIKKNLVSEKIGKQEFWYANSDGVSQSGSASVHLLPAFDEYIIAYTDRTAALNSDHMRKAIVRNGMFMPVIVISGQAIGMWKRTIKKDEVFVETDYFRSISKKEEKLIREQFEKLASFLNKNLSSLKN